MLVGRGEWRLGGVGGVGVEREVEGGVVVGGGWRG